MKGKNTLEDKPFRYGGILKDYSKEIHEINGRVKKYETQKNQNNFLLDDQEKNICIAIQLKRSVVITKT